jgi:hypothetical protein
LIKSAAPSPGSSAPRLNMRTGHSANRAGLGCWSEHRRLRVNESDKMDDDLRLAMSLSLIEARSRGEEV